MAREQDTLDVLDSEEGLDGFTALTQKSVSTTEPSRVQLASVVTAQFDGFDLNKQPRVSDLPGLPGETICARSSVSLRHEQVGARVVVVFEEGDARRPIIIGILRKQDGSGTTLNQTPSVSVEADDDRIVIAAEREIVLRCGEGSITLTKAGKILIKGTYLSSKSSGLHRIKGGSVEIN